MAISVNDKNLGMVTAYGYAKAKGFTGTEEEFAELMVSYASVAQDAADSATAAAGSASAAAGSATAASGSASAAAGSASSAAGSASAAAESASDAYDSSVNAAQSYRDASNSSTAASESAAAAARSASDASGSAAGAAQSATDAAGSATAASGSATAAAGSASDASDAADRAEAAAESIEESAEQIQTNANDITDLKDDLNAIEAGDYTYPSTSIIQGSYNARGDVTANAKRIRTTGFIAVEANQRIEFVPGSIIDGIIIGFFQANKAFVRDSSWYTQKSSIIIPYTGYIICAFKNSGNADITPSDYDAVLSIVSKWETYNNMNVYSTEKGIAVITWTSGKRLNGATGEITDEAGFFISNYIPVKDSVTITAVTGNSNAAFFDANKNWISQISIHTGTNTIAVPINAEYLVICGRYQNIQDYTVYNWIYNLNISSAENALMSKTATAVAKNIKKDFTPINLYNVDTTSFQTELLADGTEQSAVNWCASDYIMLEPAKSYELWNFYLLTKRTSNIRVVYYDIDKAVIGSVEVRAIATETATRKNWFHDFTLPNNLVYVRLSFDGRYANALMLSEYKGMPLIYRRYGFNDSKVSQKYGNNIKNVSKQGYNSLERVYGYPTYPHSSIVSFLASLEAGFNSIALAVLYTTDGVAVLSHNNDISTIAKNADGTTITSPYNITEHTYAEISAFDYGIKYGQMYEGLGILRLEDGIRFCKKYGCEFSIEIEIGETKQLFNSIANTIKLFGMGEKCGFYAYTATAISDIPTILPYADIIVGYPTSDNDAKRFADDIDQANLYNGKNHVFIGSPFTSVYTQETIDYLAAKNVGIAYANPTEEPNDIITMFTTDKNLYCTRVTSRVFPAGKLLYSSATELLSEVVSVT